MQTPVRFAPPSIGQAEIDAVVETLRGGWLTSGPKTLAFEKAFAERIGCEHAIAVSSCTAGLTLALYALGIGPGDKVATSVLTFTATVEAIVACGAEPVLLDIEPDTLNLDIGALQSALLAQPAIRAVMPIHHAGQACRMDEIKALCRPRGVAVVEDAAHALPTRYGGRMIGTVGDATVFSFYANKTMTTGEGGMVTTDDAQQTSAWHSQTGGGWSRRKNSGLAV
jgi:dTDP-4-amino-4,6-dideoxygalactose transaminase